MQKTLGKFQVRETKAASYMAGNGLELAVDPTTGKVTIKFSGKILGENIDIGLLSQAGKMLLKVAPASRFVCETHGPYMKKQGSMQIASCNYCLNEALAFSQNNMTDSQEESPDDA